MLRGHRDFKGREEYDRFLSKLFGQLNAGRKDRLAKELEVLHLLPKTRIDSCKKLDLKVGPGCTIRVNHNVYSVNSRLIGEKIQVRLYMECLEIWYGQKKVDTLPRLRGEGKYKINYRHIIDSLVRKPGAFENYRYRDAMFPTSRFRIAYDSLKERYTVQSAASRYLKILYLAAKDSEVAVDNALTILINDGHEISKDAVQRLMKSNTPVAGPDDIHIPAINLSSYDQLLKMVEA
jgi:hypothetical protein